MVQRRELKTKIIILIHIKNRHARLIIIASSKRYSM